MNHKKVHRIRAAGIVIRDGALLVMFRRRDGREYYTFPGGMVEEWESCEEAVVREIAEETSVRVVVETLCYELHWSGDTSRNAREYFYLCTYIDGESVLAIDSIEQKINDPQINFFEPRFVTIADLKKNIPLFPTEVAMQFFHDVAHGFHDVPRQIEGGTIGG